MKPEVITLCGSTKFKEQFLEQAFSLTMAGAIVLTVGSFGHSDQHKFSRKEKARLDVLHLRKIDLSDSILVLNVGNYIGESTEREIEYALSQGKRVNYLEKM